MVRAICRDPVEIQQPSPVLSPWLFAEGKVELVATAKQHRDLCAASQKRKAGGTLCLCHRPACLEAVHGLARSFTVCEARRW